MVHLILYRFIALIGFVLLLPVLSIMYIIVRLDSKGSFIFKQKRAGRGKKPFTLYKIRTMVSDAERLKTEVKRLNEADGPVFKIRHDPRYTRVGKFLSHSGLDELPQLMNVVKGDMSLVGPRPLPMNEAKLVPKRFQARFSVLPGMTSEWVVQGAHRLSFVKWMKLDMDYVRNHSLMKDASIMFQTIVSLLKNIL
ncbi:sugar transferase [Candidatus Roizmanbacteria bacterium]|nr:sugar transferase [Candidatus Roizmanbacteria bacterium]